MERSGSGIGLGVVEQRNQRPEIGREPDRAVPASGDEELGNREEGGVGEEGGSPLGASGQGEHEPVAGEEGRVDVVLVAVAPGEESAGAHRLAVRTA